MRHRKLNKKFGRSKSHREQLLRMLVSSLILNGRIRTTLPKARATRRDAEKMVTLARKGTLASRRLAAARLRSVEAVQKLFDEVVPAMAGRPGGYTRVVKLDTRKGDGAEMAFIEWVTHTLPEPKEEKPEAKKA